MSEEAARAPPQARTNSAWMAQRDNLGLMSNDEMLRMFQENPAQERLYGGRMNKQQREEAKSVTVEAMAKIHKSLETMPAEGDEEEQPNGLKASISLFLHQNRFSCLLLDLGALKTSALY